MSSKRKKEDRKLFALSDLFVILFVALASVVLFMSLSHKGGEEPVAEISVKGDKVKTIVLSDVKEPYTLTFEGAQILVSPEGVSFESSPCNDKICVRCGVISKVGESAVCLPQRVSVRIVSSDRDSGLVDAVAG